jgi:hypothetical protein
VNQLAGLRRTEWGALVTGSIFPLRLFLPIAAIPFVFFAAAASFSQPTGSPAQDHAGILQKTYPLLKRGVGAEVSFAGPGASTEEVRRSVNSVAHFIRKRSGFELDGQVIERLVKMEANALKRARGRIAIDELVHALTQTLLERAVTLTEAEMEHAADTLCGWNAADLPEQIRHSPCKIRLRAREVGGPRRETFIRQLRILAGSGILAQLAAAEAQDTVDWEARHRVEILGEALPEQWGDVSRSGLTPLQGLLISYSAFSDDNLWYSEKELRGLMSSIEKIMAKSYGRYPESAGRFAYGVNGYIFPTPLDLVLSRETLDRLLSRLEERSGQ